MRSFFTLMVACAAAALSACAQGTIGSPGTEGCFVGPCETNPRTGSVTSLGDGGQDSDPVDEPSNEPLPPNTASDGGTNPIPSGPKVFVAPTGDDKNLGTESKPVKTFLRASVLAKPGTTVLLRGGTFRSIQQITAKGTADAPILFMSYPGERAKVDGTGLNVSESMPLITLNGATYVTLRNVEVANSAGRGIDIYGGHHVTVQGCTVHDTQSRGIGANADDITLDSNEVYRAVLNNKNGSVASAGGGWSAAVATWVKPDGTYLHNFTLRGNYVHDSWGECVIALFVNSGAVVKNRIRDCWSTNLYIDHAKSLKVDKNWIYATSDAYNRTGTRRATGIGLSIEPYAHTGTAPLESITLTNNLVHSTGLGINFWGANGNASTQNTYKNIRIENNIVTNTSMTSISFDAVVAGAATPTGCTLKNNIVVAASNGLSLTLGNSTGWSVQHNDFPSGLPSLASTGNGNFVKDPAFVMGASAGSPEGYQLRTGSQCIGAGIATGVSSDDYWGSTRSTTQPSVGIHEPK